MASRSKSNSNQGQAAAESSGEPSIDDLEVSTMSIRQNVNAAKSEADKPSCVPLRGGVVAATQQFSYVSKHEHCITTVMMDGVGGVASGSYDNTVRRWDENTGECLMVYKGHKDVVTDLAVYGPWIMSSSRDKTVKQWLMRTGELVGTFGDHRVSVQCISVVGDYLYSGLGDGIVMRVSLSNHQERLQWRSGFTTVASLAVRDDGTTFCGGDDGHIRQWTVSSVGDVSMSREFLHGHTGHVDALAVTDQCVSGAAGWLFSGGRDGLIRQWSLQKPSESDNNNNVIFGSQSCTRAERMFSMSGGPVKSIVLRDGSFLAASGNTVVQRSIETGDLVATYKGHASSVTSITVSDDCNKIYTGSEDCHIMGYEQV